MDDETELNPYAPPKAAVGGAAPRAPRKRHGRADLRAALRELERHLADPDAVAVDGQAIGPRVHAAIWVCGGICVLALAGAVILSSDPEPMWAILAGIFAGVTGLLAIILLSFSLTLAPRDGSATPDAALKSIYLAVQRARFGYVWAALSPTARDQTVSAPSLGPIPVDHGDFPMTDRSSSKPWNAIKAYTGAFARASGGEMRTMGVKNVALVSEDGDVATVDVELAFQAWPRWVSIVAAVGFMIFRPLALIGIILMFIVRKKHGLTVTKTLLRGSNGAWYLFDADLVADT